MFLLGSELKMLESDLSIVYFVERWLFTVGESHKLFQCLPNEGFEYSDKEEY